jgi:UDP-galactopyranose mutase
MKATIVGAGVSGLTAAVQLSSNNWDVEVFDKRTHIGGNCHDYLYSNVYVHSYGPHIFHTDDEAVWEFISRYAQFNGYRHKVLAKTDAAPEVMIPIPYSKATEEVIGCSWSDDQIIDALFKSYSQKMWGKPWDELPPEITDRVPKRRDDHNTEYFTDKYQGMPIGGYTSLFSGMVDDIGVDRLHIGAPDDEWKISAAKSDLIVYTGSIDEYFDGCLGYLDYRTVDFHVTCILDTDRQPVAVVNECNDRAYTRKTDFSRFYADATTPPLIPAMVEYPRKYIKGFGDDPIYPMNWGDNTSKITGYNTLADSLDSVVFCGRLGKYKYLDMDDAIAGAIEAVKPFIGS